MCRLFAPAVLIVPLMISLTFGGRAPLTQASRRVVETASGRLRAVVISRPGLRPVEAFLGLQYATAERFRRPTTSARRWEGIRVARDFGPVCPQRIPDMDQFLAAPATYRRHDSTASWGTELTKNKRKRRKEEDEKQEEEEEEEEEQQQQ